MADYLIIWVDYAKDQYLALDPDTTGRIDDRLRQLAANPKADAHYDADTDQWSADLDTGNGFLLYIVNDDNQRVVILRVIYLG